MQKTQHKGDLGRAAREAIDVIGTDHSPASPICGVDRLPERYEVGVEFACAGAAGTSARVSGAWVSSVPTIRESESSWCR